MIHIQSGKLHCLSFAFLRVILFGPFKLKHVELDVKEFTET